MISTINDSLQSICYRLNKGSWNYHVDIQLFPSVGSRGSDASTIIKKALGEQAILGNTFSSSAKETLEEIEKGLAYRGDESSRPDWKFLDSEAYKEQKKEIMDTLSDMLWSCTQIIGFWLKSGHPFYPVFWDFAYILETDEDAFLLIGSSSD